ncbi:hypothetical protein BG006_004013 [Podila minutissima]|uniref:Calponin-homology (CH) domain-containing protein n=1 Tax=Podila minutissima TaxID=64525 RepID=A0A9P5SLV1_9FUNG|nr:hypothetical protein BG006_004013 [Podila minutissima]
MSVKRKLSKGDMNPNKVHRRVSGSFVDIANTLSNEVNSLDNDTYATEPNGRPTRDESPKAVEIPTLILAPFHPAPWVEFGSVVVGTKKQVAVMVENPSNQAERLALDSNCRMGDKGFTITQLDPLLVGSGSDRLVVPPNSKLEITISWTPLCAGSTRAIVILKTNSTRPTINLRGRGDFPVAEYQGLQNSKKSKGSSVYSTRATKPNNATTTFAPRNSMKQSAMRQSTMKSTNKPAPGGYSTLPYVTTNDMYDEKWIDKQERSFSQWLNYEFNVTVDSFSPKDPSSWSYYSHKLEFEHTRASAFQIYQSDTFRIVLRKVEESIGKSRLQLRADTNLVDVRIRREIIDLFFSFDIRWLVLGLETITGKAISMSPNFDRPMIAGFMNKDINTLIDNHIQAIFHDAQLESDYEPDRVLSNRPKFAQAMNRLVLKRMFMLILFLDKAKIGRLIPSDPCLFNKDSEIKSSRELLLTISRNYLMGEGDIIRHLLFMGYSVLHIQAPLDEYDFTVNNLAVDLRDGNMKFPTLSKTHMQQNVSLALTALDEQGISLEGTRGGVVTARDIVEGHREKTFGLLWKLILNWKVSVLLDLSVLEAEIFEIRKEFKRLHGKDQPDRVDTVYFTSDQLSALLRWCQAIGTFYGLSIENFTTSFADGRGFAALLSYYHPTLLDMADMKDSAKYLEEYKQGMHQPEVDVPEVIDGKGWFIETKDIKDPLTVAKEMDRFNYRLLQSKVQALGGVPVSLRHSDLSNVGIPDEKAVILFVTYLCARLMHLNKDIRAAKTIQRIWRKKHYGRREETRLNATVVIQRYVRNFLIRKRERDQSTLQKNAAVLIQTGCRAYLAQARAIHNMQSIVRVQTQCKAFLARKRYVEIQWAALTIQRIFRGHLVRQDVSIMLEEYRAAQAIQAHARGHLVRRQYILLRLAAEVVQRNRRARVEGRQVRAQFLELKDASIVLQRRWRAMLAGRAVRQELLQTRDWASQLQAQIRGAMARASYQSLQWATVVIQRTVREYQLTKTIQFQFQELRWAASVLQARWRAELAKREVQQWYQQQQWAAIKIQSFFRGRMVQRRYNELNAAALVVQRRRRALVEGREQERQFLDVRYAALVIQERWRALVLGRQARQEYAAARAMIIGIQATIRGILLRHRLYELMRRNQAAMIIQAAWRGRVQRQKYLQEKWAAIKIQRTWRAVQERRLVQHQLAEYRWAAVVIQQKWRAVMAGREVRQEYQELRQAAVTIQSHWRGQLDRRDAKTLQTIVRTQAVVRMRIARWQFVRLRTAAIVIQQQWRARQHRNQQRAEYETLQAASIVIQRRWRAVVAGRQVRQEFLETRALVVAIQAHVRGAMVRSAFLRLEWAAVTIQQRWRARIQGRKQRGHYLELCQAARAIQDRWRSVLLTRQQRHSYLDLRWASMVIQQRWRQVVYTRAMNQKIAQEQHDAAVMIQAAVRGCLLRNRIRQHFEDRERVMGQWVEVTTLSLSAMVIQRAWRQYRERKLAELHETVAVIIQRWWRGHLEAQRSDRMHHMAVLLQTQIRGVLARQRAARELEAIVLIQSWWRGHVVRQEASAKIKAARKRIEHANATAEEHMKLGNRTTMALDILLSSGQLSAVLKACYHLDVVTRLSKNSCLRLVEHNVVNIIYKLIKSCNRSQPHMEVLKHSLNIIENLSRDPDTSGAVFWATGGIEILVDSAQAYRENEMVFESVVTILLIHLEVANDHANRRRAMKTMAPEVKKLRGVLTVMERKVERETRSRPGVLASKHNTAHTAMLVSSVNKLRRIVELLR